MNKLSGFYSLLLAAGIFGFSSIIIRFLSFELNDSEQAMARMFLAALMALNIFFFKREKSSSQSLKSWQFVAFLFAFPLIVITLTVSINMIKIASAIFYLYVGKLFTAVLLDIFAFKKKVSIKEIFNIFLLVLALMIFLNPFASGFSLDMGILLGIIAGVIASVDGALRKVLAGNIDSWLLVWAPMFVGAMLSFAMMIYSGNELNPVMPTNTFLLLVLSGFLMIVVQILMLTGFKHCDINLGTIILSAELIFTMLFAAFIFAEMPSVNEIIGSLLIIVVIVSRNLKSAS